MTYNLIMTFLFLRGFYAEKIQVFVPTPAV